MAYQNLIKVELLTPENYDIWKIQMESILVKNDLWDFVSGENKIPDVRKVADRSTWQKQDRKAKADILLAISPPLLKDVKDCPTSQKVWTKLKETYDSQGPARKASLLKGLILSKMKGEENINDHVSNFFTIVDKLKSINIELDNDLLSILLLYSLPDTYENFRIAIESRDDLPKPDVLKIKIIEEFNARNAQSENADVLIANHKNIKNHFEDNIRYQRKGNSNNFVCYKCRKWGHKASQCRGRFKVKERSSIAEETTMLAKEDKSRLSYWILDSGATSHMCTDIKKFSYLNKISNSKVNLANEQTAEIIGKGKVKISNKVNLSEVLCVPELRTNLLSVSKITEHSFSVIFQKEKAIIQDKDNVTILEAKKKNGLYQIEESVNHHEVNIAKENNELTLWHERYGHLNYTTLKNMIKNGKIRGISPKILRNDTEPPCTVCIQGKHSRTPFQKSQIQRSTTPLEIIHSDVCGPIKVQSQGGARYFVSFIDDYTRWCEVYVMKNKGQVLEMITRYKAMVENLIEKRIKILRSDNGKEYVNSNFSNFLQKAGIQHQLTAEYTPQQNGVAERKNRTLVEMARCMLIQANLPTSFWAEAISTANYIRNRSSSRSLNNETPYKLWKGKNPEVKYFRTFGSLVYALDKRPGRGKFDEKSKPCLLMGYCENSKAYRLFSKLTRGIIKSRDVIFVDECNRSLKGNSNEFEIEKDNILEILENGELDKLKIENKKQNAENYESEKHENHTNEKNTVDNETIKGDENVDIQEKRTRGRPQIIRTGERGRPRKVYNTESNKTTISNDKGEAEKSAEEYETPDEEELNPEAFLTFEDCPTNVKDILDDPYEDEWKNAMRKELEAHHKNQTWQIVQKPAEKQKIINCRWVFTIKTNQRGEIIRRKARLVAKGYNQRPGIDYHETYAPVAKSKSIRILIAIAVEWDLNLYQFDVVTAYLHGDLDEDIYMCLPEHYEELEGKDINQNCVCKLQKAIYGLKQSGRAWYLKLDEKLQDVGFKQLKTEPCVYILRKDEGIILLTVYVDDIILATNNEDYAKWFKDEIARKFEIKEAEDLNYCLGIEFNKTKNGITLTQGKFIQKILSKFGMTEANVTKTPLCSSEKISKEMSPKSLEEREEMKNIPYQHLIGSLLYLSITTRPDITFAVNFLSQFNNCFGRSHWIAAKKVLRYLKGTMNYGLFFRKTGHDLKGYADADWASNIDDRKSYTGFLFKLAGAPVSWDSRKQRTVALSTAEAEYMSIAEAAKEALYLRSLLNEIGFKGMTPVTIYNDNLSAQHIAKNSITNNRSKHIDIRHHFIRDVIRKKEVTIEYLSSSEMPADMLTKNLPVPKFQSCLEKLGFTYKNCR